MNTATMTAPELFTHEWNAEGKCTNPDVVSVPGMPRKHGLAILLGVSPEGRWHIGAEFMRDGEITKEAPSLAAEGYATREEAVYQGIKATAVFFNENKKATAAIEAFYDKLKAATDADAAGEAPKVESAAAALAAPLPKGRYAEIPVRAISPNPENHRKHFDAVAMKELADSIVQNGQLQAIAVRLLTPEEEGELPGIEGLGAQAERYEIILGERRWRAHVALGRETIEAKVYEGVSRQKAKAAALVENLQRQDVNPIEEAEGYRDLMEAEGITQEQCATRVGRSRPVVANALRVLALPAEVVELIREGKLTMAHGMALHKYAKRPAVLRVIAEECVEQRTSAGQLEEWNREDYVPFTQKLKAAGLICYIGRHELPGGFSSEWPEEFTNDPDFEQANGPHSYLCWAPDKARAILDRIQAEFDAEQEAAEARRKAAAEAGKVKSLEDLDRNSYRPLDAEEQAEMAALLPEAKVMQLDAPKRGDDEPAKVTVCLAPKFAKRVAEALAAVRKADRIAKWPGILAEARATVKKWKKLGERETTALLAVALSCDEENSALLTPFSVAAVGGKFSAGLKVDREHRFSWQRTPDSDGMARFMKAISMDAVTCAKALVDDYLVRQFMTEPFEWEGAEAPAEDDFYFDFPATFSARPLFLWILDRTQLGLLEETAAGRRKLAEQVKALPWYAAAYEQASKAGEDMGEIADVTTDPKILAEWVKAQANGMTIAEIARSYNVSEKDVSGALAGRADAKED